MSDGAVILSSVRLPTGRFLGALKDLAAPELGAPQLKLYASYVTDFGGGLLMLGGDQSFGLGGYHRTPVDEVLPLRSEFQADEENPSLGLCLIIDKSGSMSGERIEMAVR